MSTSLATRCPACGTVFRVVPDQLRVSEGWVRCGRCSEVFNAAESLVDMETGAPREPAVVAPSAAAAGFELDVQAPAAPGQVAAQPPAASAAAEPPATGEVEGTVEGEVEVAGGAQVAAGVDPEAGAGPEPAFAGEAADPRAEPDDRPSFVRQAERAERWRQPRVRAALAGAALLGVAGIGAQVSYEYRDLMAARFAMTRPALELACRAFGCTVGPAHAIDSLAVESSGLVRVEKSSIYRLTVGLRNRAGIEVALPAMDLTLTDTQGQLVARKVLQMADFGNAQATLGAGRDLALQTTLQLAAPAGETATRAIVGYTIEVFYP